MFLANGTFPTNEWTCDELTWLGVGMIATALVGWLMIKLWQRSADRLDPVRRQNRLDAMLVVFLVVLVVGVIAPLVNNYTSYSPEEATAKQAEWNTVADYVHDRDLDPVRILVSENQVWAAVSECDMVAGYTYTQGKVVGMSVLGLVHRRTTQVIVSAPETKGNFPFIDAATLYEDAPICRSEPRAT